MFSCEPCGKSFTGPTPYEEHISSEKHRKKAVVDGSASTAGQHAPGADSTTRECSDVPSSSQPATNTVGCLLPLECVICKKSFSGQAPAKQHFMSKVHKKREQHLQALNGTSSSAPPTHTCSVCTMVCPSSEALSLHRASSGHAECVSSTAQQSQLAQADSNVGSSATEGGSEPQQLDVGPERYCKACECNISGCAHYAGDHDRGRVAADGHGEPLTSISQQGIEAMDSYKQQVSKLHIQTPPDVSVHIASVPQPKAIQRLAPLESPHPRCVEPLDMSFCKLCNCPFSAPGNAQQHYSGKIHRKNLRKAGIIVQAPALAVDVQKEEEEEGEYHSDEGEIQEIVKKTPRCRKRRGPSRSEVSTKRKPILLHQGWVKGPVLESCPGGVIMPEDAPHSNYYNDFNLRTEHAAMSEVPLKKSTILLHQEWVKGPMLESCQGGVIMPEDAPHSNDHNDFNLRTEHAAMSEVPSKRSTILLNQEWVKGPMLESFQGGVVMPEEAPDASDDCDFSPHPGHTANCTCVDLDSGGTTLMIDETIDQQDELQSAVFVPNEIAGEGGEEGYLESPMGGREGAEMAQLLQVEHAVDVSNKADKGPGKCKPMQGTRRSARLNKT